MRRLFAVFLIVFLPLQWGWAMAASYCQHEGSQGMVAAGAHFGHHDHGHGDGHDHPEPAASGDGDTAGHADCGTCQLSTTALVIAPLALALPILAHRLPGSALAGWPDPQPELLYRPPLPSAA